ncbi:MAG: response regulator [Polyangiaceae bacterium]|nr:response regulator [Polyangiaceae bacterium]
MAKILLVDDSMSMRAFVRSALVANPAVLGDDGEVVEAAGGFEALRLLPRGPYELVITDINMPDVNGLELVQFMRKSDQHKNTPIILISTQKAQRDKDRGLRLGANVYIEKPFTADALCAEAIRQLGRDG